MYRGGMRRRPRHSLFAPEPIDVILSRAGENRFARSRPPIPIDTWRAAVGARIAERATPVWLEAGVLVLRVPSSVWAHELSLLAEDVCARLRAQGVDARSLRFRVGPAPPIDRPAQRRATRSVPVARSLPAEVSRALDRVDDAELRSVIGRAAAANLAWQEAVAEPPAGEVSEERRAARAPRSAGAESAPPGRATPGGR